MSNKHMFDIHYEDMGILKPLTKLLTISGVSQWGGRSMCASGSLSPQLVGQLSAFLNQNFRDRWNGRWLPVAWPPASP